MVELNNELVLLIAGVSGIVSVLVGIVVFIFLLRKKKQEE